jgi:ATP-dependent Clp protease ATP-binding subunit ClpB
MVRFDEVSRAAIRAQLTTATQLARSSGDDQVVGLHLVVALLEEPDATLQSIYVGLGVRVTRIASRAREQLRKRSRRPAGALREAPSTSTEVDMLIRRAAELAQTYGQPEPAPVHLLLAICESGATEMTSLLRSEQVDGERIERFLAESFGGGSRAKGEGEAKGGPEATQGEGPFAQFCDDLVATPRSAEALVGRESELQQVVRVLGQRRQNHPLLVGDPGVGKTALVQGLAMRIASNAAAPTIQGCRILAVDMPRMRIGTSFRGEFDARLRAVLDAAAADGKVVLFFDDIHTLFDGSGNESVAVLRGALSRGDLRVLAATNHESLRRMQGEDAAFVRRFQIVTLEEPSEIETIDIVRGLRSGLEAHHTVPIADQAIESAVHLSKRYLRDQFLPDKALGLLDQAASLLRVELEDEPAALGALRRDIGLLEIECERLRSSAAPGQDRVRSAEERLSAKRSEHERALESHAEQKRLVEKIFSARGRPGVEPHSTLVGPENIASYESELAAAASGQRLAHWRVEAPEVARILSEKTGIPVARMLSSERERLLAMESEIGRRVIGQAAAVAAVCRAVRKARAGFSRKRKPIGSFFFMGPTGTGKTELAKALAEFLFDDDQHMVRLDMSEFREEHSASRLIGAPAGYVGFSEGGILTNSVRRNPFSIVLFDEIEKAHPQISTLLLQVLDEGHLSDASNRRVDFSNTIVVFTSNLGSDEVLKQGMAPSGSGGSGPDVRAILKKFFRPELINRLDDIVVFNPLSREAIGRIVDLQLAELLEQARGMGVSVNVTDEARGKLSQDGFDPEYGARPLRRLIDRLVADPMATMMIRGEIPPGSQLELTTVAGECVLRRTGATS